MKEKGLTMLEMVITMGLISVVGMLLVVIIVSSTGVFYKQTSKLSQGVNINDVLSNLKDTIRQSSGVAASYSDNGTTYTSSPTQLVLKITSRDESNNLIMDVFDYFIFFQDENKLRFKVAPNPQSSRPLKDQILSTILESVNFQYLDLASPPTEIIAEDALKVRATLTLKQKNGSLIERKIATSEASIRNN